MCNASVAMTMGFSEFDYSRLATTGIDKNTARAVVLVFDHRDSIIVSGLAQLIALSAQNVIKPFLMLKTTDNGADVNPDANPLVTLVADGETWDEKFFDALVKSGKIDRIDIVTVFSHKLSEPDGERLVRAASDLVHNCLRLAPANAMVFDHRLSVSAYDSLGTTGFGGTPYSRLILIPEDRRRPLAMAKPIFDSEPQEFDLHVAVETASLCGLWEAADGSALESLKPAASGGGVPLVVLARSFVRLARLSLPSPEEVLQRDEMLPVAVGAMRSPVPETMTEKAAQLLHPSELKCRSHDSVLADTSEEPSLWNGIRRRILSDLRKLPSRLRRRGRSEVSAAAGEAAEVLLSMTPRLLDPAETFDGSDSIEDLIPEREFQPVEVLEPQVWDDLLQDILGVADYSEHARKIREGASGDGRHLLVSKQHLAPLPICTGTANSPEPQAVPDQLTEPSESEDGLGTLYRWLSTGLTPASADHARDSTSAESLSEDFESDDSVTEDDAVAGEDSGLYARIRPQPAESPESEASEPQGSVLDSKEHEALSSESEITSESSQEASNLKHVSEHEEHKDNEHKSLLQCLTSEFDKQKTKAERAYQRCRERITEFSPRWNDRAHIEGEMSAAVPYLLAYGVILLVLCWTILPRWEFLQADVVENSEWWSRVWIIVTTVLLLTLLFLNMPRNIKQRQIYLIGGVTALIGIATWLLLKPQLIASILEADAGGFLLWLMVLGLVALIAVCVWRLVGRSNPTSALKMSAALVLVYVLVVLVAVLNDRNFTKGIGFLDNRSSTAIIVVTVVALCLVFTGIFVVSLHYYRQELEQKRLLEDLRQLKEHDENTHRQAERLASVMPHWLGTALALHRIIRLPYGAPQAPTESALGEMFSVDTDDDGGSGTDSNTDSDTDSDIDTSAASDSSERRSVLTKYVYCEMRLTDQGQEAFGRLLCSQLARPGWLYGQYRRAAEAYRASLRSLGDTAVGNQNWPNACAYPYPTDEDLPQSINGDRWPFVQRLYAGDFDPVLRKHLDTFVAGDGLDELFDEIESFSISAGAHPNETAVDVLSEIAEAPDPELPYSMLSDAVPGAAPEHPQMQSFLWWPQRLGLPATVSVPQSRTRSLRMNGCVLHQAVRVDLSEPISLTSVMGATSSPASVDHSQDSSAGTASPARGEADEPGADWEEPLL